MAVTPTLDLYIDRGMYSIRNQHTQKHSIRRGVTMITQLDTWVLILSSVIDGSCTIMSVDIIVISDQCAQPEAKTKREICFINFQLGGGKGKAFVDSGCTFNAISLRYEIWDSMHLCISEANGVFGFLLKSIHSILSCSCPYFQIQSLTSGASQKHWIRRGVAMLTQLDT